MLFCFFFFCILNWGNLLILRFFNGIEQLVCTCPTHEVFSLLCTCFFRKLKHKINGIILLRQVHLQRLDNKLSDAERHAILKARLREEGIHCGDCMPGQYAHMLCPKVAFLHSFFYHLVLLMKFLSLTFLLHVIWNV